MKPVSYPNRHALHRLPAAIAWRAQNGASLIEILVAVLVLSFGILGIAALQTRALQGNHSSLQRSQAVMLNTAMLDMMRIDRENAKIQVYDLASTCGPEGISGVALADNSRRDWLTAARDNMGGSVEKPVCGVIACTGSFDCTVSLTWDDSRSGGLTTQTLTIQGKL